MTPEERFWKRVHKTKRCWLWTGSLRDKDGYGQIDIDGKTVGVHRFAWSLHTGRKVPKGKCVCHKCDVRHCVRFKHLFIGTKLDNSHDAVRKGRLGHPHSNETKRKMSLAQMGNQNAKVA
jgi:hypothetical protein